MATADGEKKLPLLKILNVSLDYCLENFKAVAGFSAVNLLFLLVTLLLPGGNNRLVSTGGISGCRCCRWCCLFCCRRR